MENGCTVGSGRPSRRLRLEAQLFASLKCHARLAGTESEKLHAVVAEIISEQLAEEEYRGVTMEQDHNATVSDPGEVMLDAEADPLPDDASTSPGLKEFLRRVISEADRGQVLPSPKQVALSFIAFCYVLQVPFVETRTLAGISSEMNCNYTLFYRRVARWAAALGVPIPHGKKSGKVRRAMSCCDNGP